MDKIKVVSFDMEGTLVTPDFSQAVWYEAIPMLYAQRHGIRLEQARDKVVQAYQEVGDHRMEWYDVGYWFRLFQLGDYYAVLQSHQDRIGCYPDVSAVLSRLRGDYQLVVTSSSTRDFLPYFLARVGDNFLRVFSSTSDYGQLKSNDFYLKVCRELNVLPAQMAHVGDSLQFDYLVPREVGIHAFHLDRSGKATGSIHSLEQLKDKLLALE